VSEIKFYLDENVQVAVAEQLERWQIDAVSAKSLETLGDSDVNHLERATEMGRVLCTYDQDFLRMDAEGIEHAGIAFAKQYFADIGGWVRALRALHASTTAEEMKGRVEFLSMK
jgi:hypothetical protein